MKDLENTSAVFFLGNSSNYKKINKSKSITGPTASCHNFKTLNLDNLFHCKRMPRNNSDQDLFEGSSQDYENGNTDCRSLHQHNCHEGNDLLRRRKSDVSFTTDVTIDMSMDDENSNYEGKEHSFLRFLLDSIKFPKRKQNYDGFASQFINCSYTDSCRCLDCQSRYFECDDDDDDDMDLDLDFSGEFDEEHSTYSYSDYSQHEQLYQQKQQKQQLSIINDKETLQVDVPLPNQGCTGKTDEPQPAVNKTAVGANTVVYDMGEDVTMMASTPVFLSYLLNHPISCTIM